MKTITLFRHAKSDWKDSPAIEDFDRPLADRGLKAAPKMGRAMRSHDIRPDLILCSPSVRTRQTLALAMAEAWDDAPEIRYEQDVYEAGLQTLMTLLRALRQSCTHAMIVGHNPGLQNLACVLPSPKAALATGFAGKFPTASVAVFSAPVESWRSLSEGQAEIVHFLTPKTV